MKKKTFDLNKMGVATIGELEMEETNGGGFWGPIVAAYVLLEAALNPQAHFNAFMDGWNSVK